MKKQHIILISLVVIFAIFLLTIRVFKSEDQFTFNYFNNFKYKYSFKYPSVASIGTTNDYGWDHLYDQENINVSILGKAMLFEIEAKYREATSTPLKDYALKVRNKQVNNNNPNYRPEIGEFKEITFAGRLAYSFNLDKGFASEGGEYALGDGQTYNYIITQDNSGQKFIIHYLVKSTDYLQSVNLAEKIRDSFTFLETTKRTSPPQAWDTKYGEYNDHGCAYGKDSIKTEAEYFYKNTILDFSLTIPKGWFVPTSIDSDPHFYNCDYNNKTGSQFEIQESPMSFEKDYLYYKNNLLSKKAKISTDIIPNAIVMEYITEATPEGESWGYWYIILFEKEKKSFYFGSGESIINNTFISTFKLN